MEFARVPIEAGAVACWHVSGPKPPVVCVHGAGISSRESLPFVAQMRRETWAVDLPGFGRSGSLPAPASVRGYQDALAQFLERTTGTKTHLVGWSLGAQVAVSFAAAVADRVASLVLVGPTVDPRARSFAQQFGRWFRNSPYEPPSLMPQVLRDYRDAGWRHVTRAFRAALADSIEAALPQVQAPTLVLRGEHDRMVPQAWAEEATRLLPDGRLLVWPATGHMIPFAAPEEFAGTVEQFTAAVVPT